MNEKWDQRFLALAKFVSTWSKDPSTQVGAVITDKKRIVSLGFNGLPQHIPDTPEILSNRDEKYKYIVHAEKNAIKFAKQVADSYNSISLPGHTIYVYPFMPCSHCTDEIVREGIVRVVSMKSDNPRWGRSAQTEETLFCHGIELVLYENLIQLV